MVTFKAPRRSFMDEAAFCGSVVPVPYTKNYESIDPHLRSPKYRTKIKPDYDQATFLKNGDNATKSISPHSYKAQEAFNKTQVTSFKFNLRGKPKPLESIFRNHTPGPGQYEMDKAFARISHGFGKSWK